MQNTPVLHTPALHEALAHLGAIILSTRGGWLSRSVFLPHLFHSSTPVAKTLPIKLPPAHTLKLTTASSSPLPHRLTEIRAAQRTFEGAYIRTALGQFSFALIILKIFTSEFYAIGALFAAYGVAVLLVAIFRRYEGNRQFFDQDESDSESSGGGGDYGEACAAAGMVGMPPRRVQTVRKKFRTSGSSVALMTVLSLGAYITLLVLTWGLAT